MLGLDDPKQLLLVATDNVALSFHVVAERDSILSYSTPLLQPDLRISFGVFGAGVGFAWFAPGNEAHVFVVRPPSAPPHRHCHICKCCLTPPRCR